MKNRRNFVCQSVMSLQSKLARMLKERLPADPLSIFPEPSPPTRRGASVEMRPTHGPGGLVSPRSSSRLWHHHHGLAVHNLYSRVERRRNTLVNLEASVAGNVIFLTCTPPAAAASVGSPTAAACFFFLKKKIFLKFGFRQVEIF